jgi:hypothetical protein
MLFQHRESQRVSTRYPTTPNRLTALTRELDRIIQDDRYPLSTRIMVFEGDPVETATRTEPGAVTPAQTIRAAQGRDEETTVGLGG